MQQVLTSSVQTSHRQDQGNIQIMPCQVGVQPHQEPNLANPGLSGKPLVGFSAPFSHATAGPDTSHLMQHDPHSFSSLNYSKFWNTRSTSPLPRSSSGSKCFISPNSNCCKGASFNSSINDGSNSPVYVVVQSAGNFNSQHLLNFNADGVSCNSPDTFIALNNNFNPQSDVAVGPVRSLSTSSLSTSPSMHSLGSSWVSPSSLGINYSEQHSGNANQCPKYVMHVGSRSASPVPCYPVKVENDANMSTPPQQVMSSPPTFNNNLIYPETRLGLPVAFSPRSSPPQTPILIRSQSATPVGSMEDMASQTYMGDTQNMNNFLKSPSSAMYRCRSKTFGGLGAHANESFHPRPVEQRQPLQFSPPVLSQFASNNSNLGDQYRNSFTVIPFDRSCVHTPIHLPDHGPFVAPAPSSRLFMSLAVENSRKLNSSHDNTLQKSFYSSSTGSDEYQCIHYNPALQHNTAVQRQTNISDTCCCRPGPSQPATILSPTSSNNHRLSPVGFRTVSTCYNALNNSQANQVKVPKEHRPLKSFLHQDACAW